MKITRHDGRIDTTLGDLIAAISDAAFEIFDSSDAAYELASLVLLELLKSASFTGQQEEWQCPSNELLH